MSGDATAPSLRFDLEWVPAPGVTSPELAATWASLSIYAGDDCVTSLEDRATGSARKRTVVSVYPLAEWIAYNWWFFVSHSRPTLVPSRDWSFGQRRYPWEPRRPPWVPSHSLQGVGDGFHWPDLALVPDGDLMQAVWFSDSRSHPRDRIRYLGSGRTWLSKRAALNSLSHLVETVSMRLEEQGLKDTPLQIEWSELASLEPEERDYYEAAARLGIDAASRKVDDAVLDAMVEAAGRVENALLDDLFDAVGPWNIDHSARWVAQASTAYREASDAVELPIVGSPSAVPLTPDRPWRAGYADAISLRDELNSPIDMPFPIEKFIRSLPVAESTEHLEGLTGSAKPLVVHSRRSPTGERFTAARALWHSRFGGQEFALITDAHTTRQRRVRAFAAELLAPAAGIRDAVDDGQDVPVLNSVVSDVVEQFRVSPWVIQHQIENQLGRRVGTPG